MRVLIQKLTIEIAPSVQVEWYVARFPEEMEFQIWQAHLATLRKAMEVAQNYEKSAQSLQKVVEEEQEEGREVLQEGEKMEETFQVRRFKCQ